MKNLFLSLAAAAMLMACHHTDPADASAAGTSANAADAPVMTFEKDTHDFGKILPGQKVTYEFKFTNTGKTPLIITDAKASCGCTTPSWPHKPVRPGESAGIEVIFDSTGKMGLQDKQIVITANTRPAQNIVHLIGEVDLTKPDPKATNK